MCTIGPRPKRHYRDSSPMMARAIRDLYFVGRLKQRELARMFDRSQGTISKIVSNITWGHA